MGNSFCQELYRTPYFEGVCGRSVIMKGDDVCVTEQERESSAKYNSIEGNSRVYWGYGVAMVCSAKERSTGSTIVTSLNPLLAICPRSRAGCKGCDASQLDECSAASG